MKWISCVDRLPAKNELVLIYLDRSRGNQIIPELEQLTKVTTLATDGVSFWEVSDLAGLPGSSWTNDRYDWKLESMTHWAPMPKPPKKETK